MSKKKQAAQLPEEAKNEPVVTTDIKTEEKPSQKKQASFPPNASFGVTQDDRMLITVVPENTSPLEGEVHKGPFNPRSLLTSSANVNEVVSSNPDQAAHANLEWKKAKVTLAESCRPPDVISPTQHTTDEESLEIAKDARQRYFVFIPDDLPKQYGATGESWLAALLPLAYAPENPERAVPRFIPWDSLLSEDGKATAKRVPPAFYKLHLTTQAGVPHKICKAVMALDEDTILAWARNQNISKETAAELERYVDMRVVSALAGNQQTSQDFLRALWEDPSIRRHVGQPLVDNPSTPMDVLLKISSEARVSEQVREKARSRASNDLTDKEPRVRMTDSVDLSFSADTSVVF